MLGLLTHWGLFRYWWVTIKLTLTTILTGVVLFVLMPRLSAAAAASTGPSAQTFAIAERLPLAVAPAVGVTLLLIAVILAIYKPP